MLDGLVYKVGDGQRDIYDQIRFYGMRDAHIPCYVEYMSFDVTINDQTIAATQDVSLYDVSSSYHSTLVIELFDKFKEWNGWILITSNDNQCFGLLIPSKKY